MCNSETWMSLFIYDIKQRALFDAIRFSGGIRKYSELIGAKRSQVSNWVKNPSIKIDYNYAVLTEAHTCVSVERLSPETPQANQYIRDWRGHTHDVFQLPLADITIETDFKDYYRSDILDTQQEKLVLISQSKTLITGYSLWYNYKKEQKRHIKVIIIDIEALRLCINTLTELHPNLSITDCACVGAYLELMLGSCQGKRTDLLRSTHHQNLADDETVSSISTGIDVLSRKQIAQCVGFGNQESYRQAKSVIRHGISELFTAMNNKHIAIYAAAEIAKKPPKQQRQLLAKKLACV